MGKSTRGCLFGECDRPSRKKGLCDGHYQQHRKGQELRPLLPNLRTLPMEQRFWAKVNKTAPDDCWEWVGARAKGYGRFKAGERVVQAHRVSWELANGPVPEGLILDHRCANPACVNPKHLRTVTPSQNSQHLTGARRDSTSGARGVWWDKRDMVWIASVCLEGRIYRGGSHSTLEEAEAAAKALRAKLHTHDDHDEWLRRH